MLYCPNDNEDWETLSVRDGGFDPARLADAIAFAEAHESPWPRDLERAGNVPGLSQLEKPPWNEALGPVNAGYGYLWWLNTGKREWPATPESSYAAVGAGTSIIRIDPDHDLVLVARWIDQGKVASLVGRIVGALA